MESHTHETLVDLLSDGDKDSEWYEPSVIFTPWRGLHYAVTFEHRFFSFAIGWYHNHSPQREMFNFKYEQQYDGHPIKSP